MPIVEFEYVQVLSFVMVGNANKAAVQPTFFLSTTAFEKHVGQRKCPECCGEQTGSFQVNKAKGYNFDSPSYDNFAPNSEKFASSFSCVNSCDY